MNYGAITPTDSEVMDAILDTWKDCPVGVLEIGVWKGDTARGIRDRCVRNGCTLDYWGIDSAPLSDPNPPFPTAHYIIGLSEEVDHQIPEGLNFVFCDGCHCLNHVVIDAITYGAKVMVGGIMAFHDTAPHIQGVQTNRWVHGEEDDPIFRTQVVKALKQVGWPNDYWKLIQDVHDPKSDIGGMMVFRRLK